LTTGCEDIAHSLAGYFILSHPVLSKRTHRPAVCCN